MNDKMNDPASLGFDVPEGVIAHFSTQFGQRGMRAHGAWTATFAAYRTRYPNLAALIDRMQRRELPAGWDLTLPAFEADAKGLSTREAPGNLVEAHFCFDSAHLVTAAKALLAQRAPSA